MILLLSFQESELIKDVLSTSTDPKAPVLIQRINDCEALQTSQHRLKQPKTKRRKGVRTWTPEKQKAANKRYRERHRDEINKRAVKRYHALKDDPEFKDARKRYNKTAYDKVSADPEKLEKRREYFRQYYQRKKAEKLSRNNSIDKGGNNI